MKTMIIVAALLLAFMPAAKGAAYAYEPAEKDNGKQPLSVRPFNGGAA